MIRLHRCCNLVLQFLRMQRVSRRPVNVKLDAKVVAEARSLGINLSRAAEQGLVKAIADEKARLWKIENREAIEFWNKYHEEHGLPLKPLWRA